ncbi:DUF4034 domain-containing protein [Massilia pseudoviolaceinigra]|uniref:DUF4034 domain-containing protein n=1 Tax=Massilia pseudoviolaceinigra TaxID=3057165 RepID=UPI002796721E|nr:DUF4034 domain-containing protein [Massilia sp. CCM 9206]MDQ1923483.1 DUF4034 domain-containing protein [Massilia sp. CCM 9206]
MTPSWQYLSRALACAVVLLASMQSAYAECPIIKRVRPTNFVSDEVRALFDKKDYKKLDALYARYLKEKSRTDDSVSTLQAYFHGIAQSFDGCGTASETDNKALAQEASLRAWSKASPKSPAPRLALAFFTSSHGWHARGDGYVSTVSPEAWKLFNLRNASAKAQLDALAPAHKTNPAWYAGMLSVGMAQGATGQTIDALYDKGVALDPYYMDLHFNKANYYAKMWYGSREEFSDVVERAVELTRERLGQTMYTRLHWSYSRSSAMFTSGEVSWPRMKTGFEDILATFPENRTRNYLGTFACLAKDAKYLKQQLDVLGDDVDPRFWGTKRNYAYCKALAKHSDTGKLPSCFVHAETGYVECD